MLNIAMQAKHTNDTSRPKLHYCLEVQCAYVRLCTYLIILFPTSIWCSAESQFCAPPIIDYGAVPHDFCTVLHDVCMYQNTLVSFDPNYHASHDLGTNRSQLRWPLPYLNTWIGSWNIPGAMNSDAIVGNQDAFTLTLRPASRLEAAPSLQQPVFSRCTVPAVLLADWPFNFGEFFANGASAADLIFRKQRIVHDRDVTLAMALPAGLGLMTFHQALLGHLSSRPVTTLDKMAAEAEAEGEGEGAARVSWSHDGVPRSCFKRVLVCKLQSSHQASPLDTAAAVAAHLAATGGTLPEDPLGFEAAAPDAAAAAAAAATGSGIAQQQLPPLGQDDTLRVAVDVRHGGARNIRNVHQLLDACNRVYWPEVGGFRRVVCRPLVTYDTPDLSGMDRFRATIGAVRSAHVLVAVHGAGAVNSFFLRPDGGTATALLEVRPCGFGSGFPWWVDVHLAIHLPRLGDEVRFHAYNIEDPSQCSPSDWELAIRTASGPTNTRAGGGHFMRDQHLTLRPDGFLAMLRHVASMLRSPEAYGAAKAANRLHGYALPGQLLEPGKSGGVMLGPLGMEKFKEHAASGTAEFLLPPG